jgi:hypothetical protein
MKIRAISIATAMLILAGCSHDKVSTWQDPGTKGQSFKNLAVFAITKDPSVRRTTENAFVMSATAATKVTPSYKFATDEELKDKDKLYAKIKGSGFDGAVVFRVIAINEKQEEYKSANFTAAYYGTTYYGGMYYGGFDTYWGYYGAPVYSSTYTVKTQIVQIESTLYGVADKHLVFAQQSKLDNPDSTMDVIEAVVRDAATSMKKAGLIQ